jgi:hypothetical protein
MMIDRRTRRHQTAAAIAHFETGPDGKLGVLRLTADDGQAWEFRRE